MSFVARHGITAALLVTALVIYFFLYLPLFTLGALSFNNSATVSLPWSGFTLQWYAKLTANPNFLGPLFTSLQLGLVTALVSGVLGSAAALGMRRSFPGRAVAMQVMLLPVAVPTLVIGVMLLVLFQALGWQLRLFGSVLIGHVIYTIPYVFLVVHLRLQRLPRQLEEAAWDLGAGRVATLVRVILPLISPAIAAGALLAFLLSFDEFIITYFVAGRDKTLPLYIWDQIFRIINPELAALSLILLTLTVVLVTTIHLLTNERER